MPLKLTSFDRMWSSYPNPGEDAEAAKVTIGGDVNTPVVGNTCVVRVSRAMNYAGHRIPGGYRGLVTLRGADRLFYALRVAELRKYLTAVYGPPNVSYTYPAQPPRGAPPGVAQSADPPEVLRGKQGLICFVVKVWSDATGHFDLWNGDRCIHHAYFDVASSVHLWTVPGGPAEDPAAPADPTAELSGSVGQGGANADADVRRVQELLRARGEAPGAIDGACGPKTIAAIRKFQKRFLASPDGRVDPGGRTWRALAALD